MDRYIPKTVKGRAKDTGTLLDGSILTLTQWQWDNYKRWHLAGWEYKDDRRIMLEMYVAEQALGLFRSFVEFEKEWKAGDWDPGASYCIDLDKVDIVEALREERK